MGTVIRTALHDRYGNYDVTFPLAADYKFLRAVRDAREAFHHSAQIAGTYSLSGASVRQRLRCKIENFLVDCEAEPMRVGTFAAFVLRLAAELVRQRDRD